MRYNGTRKRVGNRFYGDAFFLDFLPETFQSIHSFTLFNIYNPTIQVIHNDSFVYMSIGYRKLHLYQYTQVLPVLGFRNISEDNSSVCPLRCHNSHKGNWQHP